MLLVIYFFFKGGQFKYNFQKGKFWQYENLLFFFNFIIKKDKEVFENEKEEICLFVILYFDVDNMIYFIVLEVFKINFDIEYVDSFY